MYVIASEHVIVAVRYVVAHTFSSRTDMYQTVIECPYCEGEHAHKDLFTHQGKLVSDQDLDELYGPFYAHCCKGMYHIQLPGEASLQRMIQDI